MTELVKYVDLLISNEEDAKDIFGIEADSSDITSGKLSVEGYKGIAAKLMKMFPNLKYVAFTLRESISANRNGWSGLLVDGKNSFESKKYNLDIIVRVGGGDSFGGGLIYSLINKAQPQEAIEFAVAASAIKHTIEGDFNFASVDEVKKLAGGDGSGRVVR
jgi:2-dehydro-3-deoxygluconokinase